MNKIEQHWTPINVPVVVVVIVFCCDFVHLFANALLMAPIAAWYIRIDIRWQITPFTSHNQQHILAQFGPNQWIHLSHKTTQPTEMAMRQQKKRVICLVILVISP